MLLVDSLRSLVVHHPLQRSPNPPPHKPLVNPSWRLSKQQRAFVGSRSSYAGAGEKQLEQDATAGQNLGWPEVVELGAPTPSMVKIDIALAALGVMDLMSEWSLTAEVEGQNSAMSSIVEGVVSLGSKAPLDMVKGP